MRLSGRKSSSSARRWSQHQRVVLIGLISLNAAAFVAQLLIENYQPGLVRQFLALSKAGLYDAYAWQFVTAPLLFNGPWHFVATVLALYLLGRDAESVLGGRSLLLLYIGGAFAGELGHLFLMPEQTVLYAASGGVAAVVMAYSTILPELEIAGCGPRFRLKAKHIGPAAMMISAVLMVIDRHGTVAHSAFFGGSLAGWLHVHLLGFGRPSFIQRALHQRRTHAERLQQMPAQQFIAEEVDPLLEKISRQGLESLTRNERRLLALASEKLVDE